MKKKLNSHSAFYNPRLAIICVLCLTGGLLALAGIPGRSTSSQSQKSARPSTGEQSANPVAVLGAPSDPSWLDEVQAKISGTGIFPQVDIYNITATTPTLTQLQAYGSVLVFSDVGYQNSSAGR